MAELSWPTSEVMQEHLQNLVSQGYMIAAELATCHVHVDPASPALVGGYVVACMPFYERGFGVPSHRFLRLLLQLYVLKLHHLIPSLILHIAAFVTLCKAYMRIEPHFDFWNYFFHIQVRSGSDVEAVVWGSVDISVRSGSGVDPYFRLSMPIPSVGWQKEWFFMRNDSDAMLPMFTGNRPVPQPNWGYGVAQ
jgi:hypothetical protein